MWIYIVTGIVVLLVIWSIYDGFRKEKELLERAKRTFGLAPEEEMTPERYRSLSAFLESLPDRETDIDEITWNDLDMDRIFGELNHTCSAVGEEVLFAILHRPEIVFLDEPTSGVDPIVRREFWKLIYQAAASGITIFVTTHYMDEAEYCHRISIMSDGCLKLIGTPDELKQQMGVNSIDEVFVKFVNR